MLIPDTAAEWNQLWEEKQKMRVQDHSSEYWNKRAETFGRKDSPSGYTEVFLKLAELEPTDSVFDMGCGTGNLSVPLAKEGHQVLAADFSSVMLERLQEYAKEKGAPHIDTVLLSWEDDWRSKGIEDKSFDVCFASRSIATDDLEGAIEKISQVAKRKVCITLTTGSSPRMHDMMLRDIGLALPPSFDAVYAMGILLGLGYLPRLTYIDTHKHDAFASVEDAVDKYTHMARAAATELHDDISDEEIAKRVKEWLNGNLVETENNGKREFELAVERNSPWAFIWWDVS